MALKGLPEHVVDFPATYLTTQAVFSRESEMSGILRIKERRPETMRNVRWILLAIAVLVIVTLACGPSGETPTAEVPPTAEVEPTLPPADTPMPVPSGAMLEIINNSGTDVWYVYMSPSEADQWGEDWLEGHVIRDGETHTITDIPEGTYDVRAEDENNEAIEIVWGADVEGQMTWTITGLSSLEVINESSDTIVHLYISPSDSETWGDDWLAGDTIGAGGSYTVSDIPRGTYDIQAADADENSVEVVYNVSLSGYSSWTVVGKTPLPDNAVLRFEDGFSDNRNNWGLDTEDEDVFYMRPADGEYCILIKSNNFTAWEWYEPFRTDEFVAEVACYLEGADDASCGLGFGPDGDNLYWFEVSPSDQGFALFLLEGGDWQEKLVDWTVSRNISPDQTNYLSMERVGGVVSLYVNGVLIGQIDSDRFPTGRVGIGGSTYDQGHATVCLDNLSVWRLE
jgi:hypothetical protein